MAGYLANPYSEYSNINPTPSYRNNIPSISDGVKNSDNSNSPDVFYKMYQQSSNEENYDRARYATLGLFEKNHITVVFFSNENIKRLQKKIREEIFIRTKGQYSLEEDQDESELLIAMRAVYLEKCKNLPNQTVRQVKLLNKQTVDYIVPDMISNIKQYFGYLKDINQPLQPMLRPMNVNNAGRNLLPSITTIWR